MKISDDAIADLLSRGFSQSEIARQYSCSRQAIHSRLHSESKPKEHLRWARHTKVYWFLIQGLSTKEIAKRVGITEGYVSFFKSDLFPCLKSRPGRRRKRGGMR